MHISVLLHEAVQHLIKDNDLNGLYIDGTFGRGGHSREILKNLNSQAKLISFDKDIEAINTAKLTEFSTDNRFSICHTSFSNLVSSLVEKNIAKHSVNGILLDLGISSPQIDTPERGFSFMRDGILDMRMDTTRGKPLYEVLPQLSEENLAEIILNYGEDKMAKRIAKAIKNFTLPIKNTSTLASIVANVVKQKSAQHPATRTFQALRIYINRELEDLKQVLSFIPDILADKGKVVIISFHSLEDRIVKQAFNALAKPNIIDASLPRHLQLLQKTYNYVEAKFTLQGKFKPSCIEIANNPRARSAIMRVISKN